MNYNIILIVLLISTLLGIAAYQSMTLDHDDVYKIDFELQSEHEDLDYLLREHDELLDVHKCTSAAVSGDYDKAVPICKKYAEKGNALAQAALGSLYATGSGVEQNDKLAFMWISKSAAQGEPIAQGKLGAAYFSGRGVHQDYALGYMWLTIAAANGDKESLRVKEMADKSISPVYIAEGQRLAREWLSKHRK